MLKEIWLDVETTGLWPKTHALIQLSGMIFIDGEKMETFNYNIMPFASDKIEDAALKVNGISREALESFSPPSLIYRTFLNLLEKYVHKFNTSDKFLMYAYNARFDDDFLRAFFKKLEDRYYGSYFFFPPIDVMNLAIDHLKSERSSMKNFKQGTVAEKLGIEIDQSKLHDALYDVEVTRMIYTMIKDPINEVEIIPVDKESTIIRNKK